MGMQELKYARSFFGGDVWIAAHPDGLAFQSPTRRVCRSPSSTFWARLYFGPMGKVLGTRNMES
jgi:hypothetical protein